MRTNILLSISAFLFAFVGLQAQKPELVLPVIHSKPINHISFSLDGRYMVSNDGNDLKIWEVVTGKLIRTVPAKENQAFSKATISADEKWLIAATSPGWVENEPTKDQQLLLFDPLSGKQLRQIHVINKTHIYNYLEISADNRYLLAVITSLHLIDSTKVFDLKTGAEISAFPGKGRFDDRSKNLVLLQENALILAEIETEKTDIIAQEPCLAVQKAGELITFLTSAGHLKHWDSQTKMQTNDFELNLTPALRQQLEETRFGIDAEISRDGKRCAITVALSDLGQEDTLNQTQFLVFDARTGKTISDHITSDAPTFTRRIYSPDLQFLVSAPLQDNGSWENLMKAFSTESGKFSHAFGLSVLERNTQAHAFGLETWMTIYNQGKIIRFDRPFNPFEIPSFLYYTETGRSEVLDPADSLSAYAAKHALKQDTRWLMECKDRISYQIIDAQSKQTVATLLIAEGQEHTWAVTTPAGLFDASPDMMQSLHYVSGMEIIDLEQLKARYYEPGLLAKIFGLSKETIRSVEEFNEVELYPEMSAKLSEDKLQLLVNLKPRNGGIGKLTVFVNGKEMKDEDVNPQRAESLTIDLRAYADYYLPNIPNKLVLRVYNKAGWLKSAALELDYQPPATARGNQSGGSTESILKGKPGLFALVVGTSNYAGENLDLKYADKDAACFAQAIRAAGQRLFGDKVSVSLLNTDASDNTRLDASSKTSIKKAFADIAAKAKAQDVLVVYFSGHGVNYGAADNSQFYYLTKDIASENLSDPGIRENFAVSSTELTEWIKAIPALKQVMILDACNAGKVVEDLAAGRKDLSSTQVRALDRMKDRTGMFILTGSAADKVSYEAGQYGQGLLTYSLLQGMSGLALTQDKRVDVMTLFQYSRDHVPDLSKGIGGIQTPILAFPASGASFDIGIVDATVKIPLAQVKPVFIRNVFQDEDTFDDVLGLTPALANYFQDATARGGQSDLIYVDVSEYENAYAIKGRYKVSADVVDVRGRLFKGKTAVGGEFKVSGKKTDVPGLAEMILEKAMEILK